MSIHFRAVLASTFRLNVDMRSLRAESLAILAASALMASGCGPSSPLPLSQVRGTVKYSDGSLIKADQIRIVFQPQGVEAQGKVFPRAAETYADVSTGAFGELTTWSHADGALVGQHKVVVTSLKLNSHGVGDPTLAVPKLYNGAETTPLEVEVVDGGENNFTLTIDQAQ